MPRASETLDLEAVHEWGILAAHAEYSFYVSYIPKIYLYLYIDIDISIYVHTLYHVDKYNYNRFQGSKRKITKFSLLMLNMFTLWGTYACTFLVFFLFFLFFRFFLLFNLY